MFYNKADCISKFTAATYMHIYLYNVLLITILKMNFTRKP